MKFPRLCTPAPDRDPLTSVDGVATVYPCPTLEAVDEHLAALRVRIVKAGRFPRLVALYRTDTDRLLDRRAWLMLDTTETVSTRHPCGEVTHEMCSVEKRR